MEHEKIEGEVDEGCWMTRFAGCGEIHSNEVMEISPCFVLDER